MITLPYISIYVAAEEIMPDKRKHPKGHKKRIVLSKCSVQGPYDVDTQDEVVAQSEEEGEQSHDGETTHPPKQPSSKLSLLASQVDKRKKVTSQIPKQSPTKKKKMGSARHQEQSGISVNVPPRQPCQEAGQSLKKGGRFKDAEYRQSKEEMVSRSHSDEVDTQDEVVAQSEEEGEQSHDGETTHPPKQPSSKLSLLASQVDKRKRVTSQIPKQSPTKKKKQGSARHLEEIGISVNIPMRQPSQESGNSPRKRRRIEDSEYGHGKEEVVSRSHSDDVDTQDEVVAQSEEEGEQSHDGETTHPPKQPSSKLSLLASQVDKRKRVTSQIPKQSPTKKKKQGSARHLEEIGISVNVPPRQPCQEAGQSLKKGGRFKDAEYRHGKEEVVSRSHSDDVDTQDEVVAQSEEEGEQSHDGETTHPPKQPSSKLSLLASQVDKRKRVTSQIPKQSPTKKKKQGSARHLEEIGISVNIPMRQPSQEARQSPIKGKRFKSAKYGDQEATDTVTDWVNKSKNTQTQGKGTLDDKVKTAGLLRISSDGRYPRARLVMHNIEKSGKVKQKSEKTIPTDNKQTYAKGSRLHSETERQRKSVQALLNIRTTDSALHRIAFTRGQFTMTIFDILI